VVENQQCSAVGLKHGLSNEAPGVHVLTRIVLLRCWGGHAPTVQQYAHEKQRALRQRQRHHQPARAHPGRKVAQRTQRLHHDTPPHPLRR
jgi:hypothetical protein